MIDILKKVLDLVFKRVIRPIVFQMSANDPEIAHEIVMRELTLASHLPPVLSAIQAMFSLRHPSLERDVFGIRFPNPVGLAGGFDKNGQALPAIAALGFGFIEAGGVTRYPQPGQSRPRIFRLNADQGLINRMGLPSKGADAVADHLAHQQHPDIPIGWQLAKSKVTPLEEAAEDYVYSLQKLYPFADYFSINVSSPNTPRLRSLQERAPLERITRAVVDESRRLAMGEQRPKPILLKISPDLHDRDLIDIVEVCLATGISGIIATNTTITREGIASTIDEVGGMSGKPLAHRSLEVVAFLVKALNGALPVVGVGGIFTAEDAQRMFDAGAALIQVYTSFIYEGPAIAKQINAGLLHMRGHD